jgi:hypothetical protein
VRFRYTAVIAAASAPRFFVLEPRRIVDTVTDDERLTNHWPRRRRHVKERGRAGVAGNSFQGIAQEMLGGVATANLRKVRRFA